MSKRCKHVRRQTRGRNAWMHQLDCYKEFPVCICLDCGAWLSLGPANDEPEAVRVEIRAAELTTLDRCSLEQWPCGMTDQEPHGWIGHKHDDTPIEPRASYWAGYLAREIATHENEDGEP